MIKLIHRNGLFYLLGDPDLARDAGFEPVKVKNKWAWTTSSLLTAYNVRQYADDSVDRMFWDIDDEIANSLLHWSPNEMPAPEGLSYFPFQIPAIEYALRYDKCLIADDMGLGKTIESIGVANALGLRRILVICPAQLRDNWTREMHSWHMHGSGLTVLRKGGSILNPGLSVIISYELLDAYYDLLMSAKFDMCIVDEAHRIKNREAKRTQLILGNSDIEGIAQAIPRVILLTGSPVRNWPEEIYWILRKLRPEVIDNMDGGPFLRRFCTFTNGDYGVDITGTRNEKELYNRLRSGFMVRRVKTDVLPDLPELQYKMVVYPASGEVLKVLRKEKEFDAREIYTHGIPIGSPYPEVRHELSVAKVDATAEYVRSLYADGAEKVLIFGHHVLAMQGLYEALEDCNPAMVIGATKNKQSEVDRFQEDPECRLFIGNDAAFEGYNLTAGAEVVFHECSFVPEDLAQAIARAFRIGQTCKVTAHILLIEGSIEAYVLGRSAKKLAGIKQITDGVML